MRAFKPKKPKRDPYAKVALEAMKMKTAIAEVNVHRKVVQNIADKIAPDLQALEEASKIKRALMVGADDEKVRLLAARSITDDAKYSSDINLALYNHDNPAIQRSELTHKNLPPIPTTLTVRIVE